MDVAATCNCAMSALHKYGYTVVDADKAAGFFTAERRRKEISIVNWFVGNVSAGEDSGPARLQSAELIAQTMHKMMLDKLSVSVVEDSSRQLTVSATGTTTSGKTPSETYVVKRDIRRLLDMCAQQPADNHSRPSAYRVSQRP
jgi:hypothetical protein